MVILILSSNKEITDRVIFALESELKVLPLVAQTVQEAISLLLDDRHVDLVLAPNDANGMMLFKYLLSTGSSIPNLIMTGENEEPREILPDLKVIGQIRKKEVLVDLKNCLEQAQQKGLLRVESSDVQFCRIRTDILVRVAPLKADIFIKLSNVKYIKMFRSGMKFTDIDLDRYLFKKKLGYLYIRREDAKEFIPKFIEDIKNVVSSEKLTEKARIEFSLSLHETIVELHRNLGFTEEVMSLAKENVQMTMQTIGNNPKLTSIFAGIPNDKGSYLSSHSMMLAHVACAMASKMDWPSKATFLKITFAALFHDITIHNANLAAISDLNELSEYKHLFSEEEIESYKRHPTECAELVMKFQELPAEVDHIVRQHHEKPDGSGFPRGLTASFISPLAALFVVAHDLVQFVIEHKGEVKVKEFVEKYSTIYDKGGFKKALAIVQESLK